MVFLGLLRPSFWVEPNFAFNKNRDAEYSANDKYSQVTSNQRKERLVTHREKSVLVFQCTQRHPPVGDGMFLSVHGPLG